MRCLFEICLRRGWANLTDKVRHAALCLCHAALSCAVLRCTVLCLMGGGGCTEPGTLQWRARQMLALEPAAACASCVSAASDSLLRIKRPQLRTWQVGTARSLKAGPTWVAPVLPALPSSQALALCKCVNRRMWGSQTPLRQFRGIPNEILGKVRPGFPAGFPAVAGKIPRVSQRHTGAVGVAAPGAWG